MNQTVSKQFHAALMYLLAKEGRGAQSRLARQQEIDRGYLNAIVRGRKSGAEEIRTKIAVYFRMTYEEMLTLGRTILSGGGVPGEGRSGGEEKADYTSTEIFRPVYVGSGEPEKTYKTQLSIADKMAKTAAILESEGRFREVFSDLIEVFSEAVNTGRDNLSLRNQIGKLERRNAELERLVGNSG